eukprot:1148544-Pelagomonas_calceolata.AAC.2
MEITGLIIPAAPGAPANSFVHTCHFVEALDVQVLPKLDVFQLQSVPICLIPVEGNGTVKVVLGKANG